MEKLGNHTATGDYMASSITQISQFKFSIYPSLKLFVLCRLISIRKHKMAFQYLFNVDKKQQQGSAQTTIIDCDTCARILCHDSINICPCNDSIS